MARKEKKLLCRNVFKGGENIGNRSLYTSLWIEYINQREENKRMDSDAVPPVSKK